MQGIVMHLRISLDPLSRRFWGSLEWCTFYVTEFSDFDFLFFTDVNLGMVSMMFISYSSVDRIGTMRICWSGCHWMEWSLLQLGRYRRMPFFDDVWMASVAAWMDGI